MTLRGDQTAVPSTACGLKRGGTGMGGLMGLRIAVVAAFCLGAPWPVVGQDLPDRFLERLQAVGYHDMALLYLDKGLEQGGLPERFERDAPLIRAELLLGWLPRLDNQRRRQEVSEQIESLLTDFLETAGTHPRRGEARFRLANLYVTTGQRALEEFLDQGEASAATRAEQALSQAADLFAAALEDLRPQLEALRGGRIDPSDSQRLRQRDQLLMDYRQAEVLQALSLKGVAQVQGEPGRGLLQQAAALFSGLIEKTNSRREAGTHILSRLYLADTQVLLEQWDLAIDNYQRVRDYQEELPQFRRWRAAATAGLIDLYLRPEQAKYALAAEAGQQLLSSMRGDERPQAEWVRLQLATAEALLAAGGAAERPGDRRGRYREVRRLLQPLLATTGQSQRRAAELLRQAGAEIADEPSLELPEAKTFADALRLGRQRLETSENAARSLDLLSAAATESDVPSSEEGFDREQMLEMLQAYRLQAIELFRKAERLWGGADTRDDLLRCRQLQAFTWLRLEGWHEAAAIGQFVAHQAAGTEVGLQGAQIALVALSKLVEQADSDRLPGLMAALERLSVAMLAAWPTAVESQEAAIKLVQLALADRRWEEALQYADLLPPESPRGAALQLDLGYVLWNQLRSATAAELSEAELTRRTARAERLLQAGSDSLTGGPLSRRSIEGLVTLADVRLRAGDWGAAERLLERPEVGLSAALERAEASAEEALPAGLLIDILRLQLHTQIVRGGATGAVLEGTQVEQVLERMQQLADTSPTAASAMDATLVQLAADLQRQVRTVVDRPTQVRLAEGLWLVMEPLVEQSRRLASLHWAGDTLLALADALDSGGAEADVQRRQLLAGASLAYRRILTEFADDAEQLEQRRLRPEVLRFRLASSLSGQAEYAEAHRVLVELLEANPNLLTAQLEAARNLKRWAAGRDVARLQESLLGAEPRGARGDPIVWGWGRLGVTLQRAMATRAELADAFFEARYELAEGRLQLAQTQADQRERLARQALEDVRQTWLTYPQLGGESRRGAFDALTRRIQGTLGQPQRGLAAFERAG
jgi:hypothetical protein